mmetsp:Transcript_63692/g.127969  ORF Transcript_63692/g.127969 Transcript_63692/m.127969 type:complete len:339 (-) Transcript_63692:1738-2754(-)
MNGLFSPNTNLAFWPSFWWDLDSTRNACLPYTSNGSNSVAPPTKSMQYVWLSSVCRLYMYSRAPFSTHHRSFQSPPSSFRLISFPALLVAASSVLRILSRPFFSSTFNEPMARCALNMNAIRCPSSNSPWYFLTRLWSSAACPLSIISCRCFTSTIPCANRSSRSALKSLFTAAAGPFVRVSRDTSTNSPRCTSASMSFGILALCASTGWHASTYDTLKVALSCALMEVESKLLLELSDDKCLSFWVSENRVCANVMTLDAVLSSSLCWGVHLSSCSVRVLASKKRGVVRRGSMMVTPSASSTCWYCSPSNPSSSPDSPPPPPPPPEGTKLYTSRGLG